MKKQGGVKGGMDLCVKVAVTGEWRAVSNDDDEKGDYDTRWTACQ